MLTIVATGIAFISAAAAALAWGFPKTPRRH